VIGLKGRISNTSNEVLCCSLTCCICMSQHFGMENFKYIESVYFSLELFYMYFFINESFLFRSCLYNRMPSDLIDKE